MFKYLNKGISTPIAIIIIVVCALLVGGITVYQYYGMPEEEEEAPGEKVSGEETGFTIETLKNGEYYSAWYDEMVQLTNGQYFREYPGSASGLYIGIFKDLIALGDLNNDGEKDAAVVLDSRGGGSGHFYEIAVMINEDGNPRYLLSEKLGDRVIINSITIQSGEIILNMVVHGPDDGLCCPSVEKIFKYKLVGDQLIEMEAVEITH